MDSDLAPPEMMTRQPEVIEMDRSDQVPPDKSPPDDSNSLSRKLRAHYQRGMKKTNVDPLASILTPQFINSVAVPVFLFTVISSVKIGYFDVMPQIYKGQETLILFQRCIVLCIFLQVMVNWCGIRYVDSSYRRFIRLYGKPKLSQSCGQRNRHASVNKRVAKSSGHIITDNAISGAAYSSLPTGPSAPCDSLLSNSYTEMRNVSNLYTEADRTNSEMDRIKDQRRSVDDLLGNSNNYYCKDERSMPFVTASPSPSLHNSSTNSGPESATIISKRVTASEQCASAQRYRYWSWTPCFTCGWTRPPRCHHCPVCLTCVLKRDHHCFFAGACVGYRNHRFFCVFLVWAWMGCMYATLHGFPYIYMFLWEEHMSFVDGIFPMALVRYSLGYVPFQVALSVTTLTLLLYFDCLTMTLIYAHSRLVGWGLTSFEKAYYVDKSFQILDTRTGGQKLRAVFGKNWLLALLFPTNFMYEPEEDPIEWPDIKVFKR